MMPSDEDYEWTISPQARKQLAGVLSDLEHLVLDKKSTEGHVLLAAALLLSMAVERAALIQIQAAEKMEIMKMSGGPKILKL